MPTANRKPEWLRADFVFAVGLFIAALGALWAVAPAPQWTLLVERWETALFFFAFGLFTIVVGFPHPSFGHVSFDRVAQVASVLVLGPVAGAIVNGAASLVFPWSRLGRGKRWFAVGRAALMNSGLMTLVVLAGGFLYTALGGSVPLQSLDRSVAGPLVVLVVVMQLTNHAGMALYVYLHGGRPGEQFNVFTTGLEIVSGLIAVIVALIFNRLELAVFVVFLVVLGVGMFAIKQFAIIRQKLEMIVDERTRALQEKSRELERQATQDKLTGLYNRRYADDYLNRQLGSAGGVTRPFAVALADIDHFKAVNDHYSHAQGDQVLVRVAQLLTANCRAVDMVARYGGEEFLLCFPGIDLAGAAESCERLRGAVEAADWSFVAADIFITISFGIAENRAGIDASSLLALADDRLYDAKRAGRNRVAGAAVKMT